MLSPRLSNLETGRIAGGDGADGADDACPTGVYTEEPEAAISSSLPLAEMVCPGERLLTFPEQLDPQEESEDNSPGDLDLVLDQG